jgi:mono/diheme cytochrome c family protein
VTRPCALLLTLATLALVSMAASAGEPVAAGNATAPIPLAPVTRAPARLSQTGLYADDGSIDPRNRSFVPQYPLWTDGAAKARWMRLPDGAQIDTSDLDAWRFPPGTTFWKEFAWAGRKVETRMIRRDDDGSWVFASYVWSADQRDAELAPSAGIPAAFELETGKQHSIPAIEDCTSCHGSSPAVALGFSALQLSDDRDPLAPHAEPVSPGALTLRTLIAERRLTPGRTELLARPPRIRADDPVARAALGYLSANCGGCHNSRGPLARLGFSLLHDASAAPGAPEPGQATTTDAHGRYVVPGFEAESSRIVAPGAPELSTLLYRMSSRRASSQMPPVGSVVADRDGIALVQRWIVGLASDDSVDPQSRDEVTRHASSPATGRASGRAQPPSTTPMYR